MGQVLLSLFLVILAVPVGFLVAWMARDELVIGRKWFVKIILLGAVVGGWFALTGFYAGALTCLFIVIATYVSYHKSFDKKFVKMK